MILRRKTVSVSYIAKCEVCGREGDRYSDRESCVHDMRARLWFVQEPSLLLSLILAVMGRAERQVLCPACVEITAKDGGR